MSLQVDIQKPKGGEFLVHNIWMSADPYMRGRIRSPQETKNYISSFQINKPLDGGCVGQIIESRNKDFTVGICSWGLWIERILDFKWQ